MKIVFTLHDDPNPNAGGMGVTVALADAYRQMGHDVAWITFGDLPAQLPFRVKALLFPYLVAARLRKSRADVLDCAVGDGWLLGLTRRGVPDAREPLLTCRSHGLAQIATRHHREEVLRGNLELSWKYPIYWGGIRLREEASALRGADLSLMLNGEEERVGIEQLGLDAARIRIVDNGLSDEFLGRRLPALEPARGFRIAHIGSYLPHKGVHYSAAALAGILRSHPSADVTYFGTGSNSDQVRGAFPTALLSRVSVVPAYSRDELPKLLNGHSAVITGTLHEPFMLSTLEAMACGLVPVVTDTPGPTRYVRDRQNGLVVPRADSTALEAAVSELITNPGLWAELRSAAHATAQDYGWPRIARQTLGFYEEALERRRRDANGGRDR